MIRRSSRCSLRCGRASSPPRSSRSSASEIARIASDGVTDAECAKARTQIEAEVIFDRDSSDQIAASLSEAIAVADWEWYADYPVAIQAVTPEDVRRVVLAHLHDDGLTVGLFLPKTGAPAQEGEEADEGARRRGRGRMSVSAPARRAPFAEAVRQRTLANGARFFVLENHFNPTLAISGSMRAGRLYAPPDRRMIASMTAGELMKGTARRTKLQLAEDLESRAVGLSITSDASDPVGVDVSGAALSRETDVLFDALAEVLRTPTFPAGRAREGEEAPRRLDPTAAGSDLGPRLRAALARIYPPAHPLHRLTGQERIDRVGGAEARRPRVVLRRALRRGLARSRGRRRRRRGADPRSPRGRASATGLPGPPTPIAAPAVPPVSPGIEIVSMADKASADVVIALARGPAAHGRGLPRLFAGQRGARPVLADLPPRRPRARHRGADLRDPLEHLGHARRGAVRREPDGQARQPRRRGRLRRSTRSTSSCAGA